jgi:hypothetical protein
MPFGLANAPASFQSYIDRALAPFKDITCVIYLNDILIFSENEEEHEHHVRQVLQSLREFKLYAKLSKCAFHIDRVNFLGFVITTDSIEMEPECIQTIMEWPEPKTIKDIQAFLSFANFYRHFIKGYSKITAPLTDLTKKDTTVHFPLESQARKAFLGLKNCFTQPQYYAISTHNERYKLTRMQQVRDI